jgi:multiple sugar transport system permease protein
MTQGSQVFPAGGSVAAPRPERVTPTSIRLRQQLGRDWATAWLFLLPCAVVVIGLIGYPFVSAIVLAFQAKLVGAPAAFVGLANFNELFFGRDVGTMFRQSVWISIFFTVTTQAIKMVLGLMMALLLNERFPGRNIVRGVFFIPWAIPTLIAGLTWKWMYDGTQIGLLNMVALKLGLTTDLIQWLGNYSLAPWSVVIAVVWASTPFWAMMLLAGLQAIPSELYEASEIDGADVFQRFANITLPGISNILIITLMLSTIWTANSINFVYILTGGGPANATMIFPLLAYQVGVAGAQRLGMGAAISLAFFPLFLILIYFLTRRMLAEER